MALVTKPWIKNKLLSVLAQGWSRDAASVINHDRLTSARAHKKHVQCVEVHDKADALKINDGDKTVWCFVSRDGLRNFVESGGESLAGLNNKTITLQEWEFSFRELHCRTADEAGRKISGRICLLITKFALLSGERTTTLGRPTGLGEGDRDIQRLLNTATPKDVVSCLERGQGLSHLQDQDGVLIGASTAYLGRSLSWDVVETDMLIMPSDKDSGDSTGSQAAPQGSDSNLGRKKDIESASNSEMGHEISTHGYALSQESSLGMEMEEESGAEDYSTQALQEGNVFSQEAMEIRSPSPSPSTLSEDRNDQSLLDVRHENDSRREDDISRNSNHSSRTDDDSIDHTATGDQHTSQTSKEAVLRDGIQTSALRQGATTEAQICTEHPPRVAPRVTRLRSQQLTAGEEAEHHPNTPDQRSRDSQEEGDEEDSLVPPGFTQVDIMQEAGESGRQQFPKGREKAREKLRTNDTSDVEHVSASEIVSTRRQASKRRGDIRTSARLAAPEEPYKRDCTQLGTTSGPTADRSSDEDHISFRTRKGKGKPRVDDEKHATDSSSSSNSHPQPSNDETSSEMSEESEESTPEGPPSQALTVGTSLSSDVASPSQRSAQKYAAAKWRGRSARVGDQHARQTFDIRNRFADGKDERPDWAKSKSRQRNRRRQGTSNEVDEAHVGAPNADDRQRLRQKASMVRRTPPATGIRDEYGRETIRPLHRRRPSILPTRGLSGGPMSSTKRARPLSDLVVALDRAENNPKSYRVTARGYDANRAMALWLDMVRPEKRLCGGVGDWLNRYYERREVGLAQARHLEL